MGMSGTDTNGSALGADCKKWENYWTGGRKGKVRDGGQREKTTSPMGCCPSDSVTVQPIDIRFHFFHVQLRLVYHFDYPFYISPQFYSLHFSRNHSLQANPRHVHFSHLLHLHISLHESSSTYRGYHPRNSCRNRTSDSSHNMRFTCSR